MRKIRLTLIITLTFVLLTFGLKFIQKFNISKELKKEEKERLEKSAEVLSKCFDLQNKSKRSINESMDLIEYCLNNYGTKK